MSQRRLLVAIVLAVAAAAVQAQVQQQLQPPVAGRNVNMVSGDQWPDGDPYLQRQNEPSLAASTRNPLHLLAGSNDYRTVDLPVPVGDHADGDKVETGDAWLGLYKSLDGGQRWKSTLLPGYPQDTSAVGRATPMFGYQAGADPVVRPGAAGLFYYAGLVFDRTGDPVTGAKKSRIFVSRFIDNNNKEAGDPIQFLGATAVASDSGETGAFLDKPWMAVDIPRPGAKSCTILSPDGTPQQTIKAGAVYVTYTVIRGDGANVTGTIMFTRSIDCGQTWSAPIALSRANEPVNQGTTIAIDPVTGTVYVAWRQFASSATAPDSIVVVKSAGAGGFERPRTLRQFYAGRSLGELIKFMLGKRKTVQATEPVPTQSQIQSFDQRTADDAFRTNTYPTMAIDGTGRIYVAWTERGKRAGNANTFDSSIVMSTSRNGTTWTTATAVEPHTNPGHQIMPSLAFGGGKLTLVYYDLREDIAQVFGFGVNESEVQLKRHTVDLRAAQADPADVPDFGTSTLVSQYVWGSRPGSTTIEQLQFNPPNLPLFQLGNVPFMGDYVDVAAAPAMVQDDKGNWKFNTAATTAPVFHAAWTDNRDVKPPTNGDWANYTPPSGTQMGSVFDPSQSRQPCSPGNAGMRNQNVYTSRITAGLLAGSPGNSKPLDPNLPRSFVVFAQNTTDTPKYFRMTITSQPVGGRASFAPLISDPLVTVVDVTAPARSTVSRTVVVTSTNPDARIPVDITEIGQGGTPVPNPLNTVVLLNPDISNPDISNPDISNPDISNPDISNAEVYNPDISNPDISNPDISNPDISNPDISNPDISNVVILNPDISNPDISNPDISNPDISNPDISNPDISNPDISNGSLTDTTWTITNTGNTTANYTIDVLGNVPVPAGIKVQIIVYKTYKTPVSDGCTLKYTTHTVLVSNTVDPSEVPSIFLEPGGEGKITLRIVDPDPTDAITLNPLDAQTPIAPTVEATTVNSEDINDPTPEPPDATPPSVTTTSIEIVTQPSSVLVSTSLGDVRVRVMRTVDSETSPLAGATVGAGLVVNPVGGNLSGTTAVATNADGYATFSDLAIDRAGNGFQLAFSASGSGASPAVSSTFSITVPAAPDPTQNFFVVTNTADSGPGSLRAAVINANGTANGPGGPDVVVFQIRAAGPYKIMLQTPLPEIVDAVIIDGSTQTGFDAETRQPVIEVAGSLLPDSSIGFNITGGVGPKVIKSLSITEFGKPSTMDTTAAVRVNANDVFIEGNWIGMAPDGSVPGNQTGIWVTGGNPVIGGTGGALRRNILVGGRAGIYASGGNLLRVFNNFIGVGPDGITPHGNTGFGISLQSPDLTNAQIGGPLDEDGYFGLSWTGNVISANGAGGIQIQDTMAGGPVNTGILGNIIGLDVNGADLGNAGPGVEARGSFVRIGAPNGPNVISGNGRRVPTFSYGPGVVILPGGNEPATMPWIDGNLIGTDITGTVARPNTYEGIVLYDKALVGSATPGGSNVIAGNGEATIAAGTGVLIAQGAGGSRIEGNRIGLGVNGAALGNGYSGITMIGTQGTAMNPTIIGGNTALHRNVISGNPHAGIAIYTFGPVPQHVWIKGNYIGTDPTAGISGVGNGVFGVQISSGQFISLGEYSLQEGNVIAGNGTLGVGAGVRIDGNSTHITLRTNLIVGNNGLGIDLAAIGPDTNDNGDLDAGPNDRQNYPVLDGVFDDGVGAVTLSLNSRPGNYVIQVFRNSACDPSGYGEGQEYLFERNLTIVAPATTATLTTAAAIVGGQSLSATATNLATGETSEFSACNTVRTITPEYVGPVGGTTGGSAFTLTCGAGTVATALRGRAGDDIDRTELWCSPASNPTAAATLAGAVGGFGGTDYNAALTCPSGYVITGLHGRYGTVLWGGFIVDTIGVVCTHPVMGWTYTSPAVGGTSPATTPFTLSCSAGKKASGIFGRQGGLLDAIGLTCK